MTSDLLLACDIGTTGLKATLFTSKGSVLAAAMSPYSPDYGPDGAAEQEPATWWHALCSAMADLVAQRPEAPNRIAAIGLSGMMNGCVLVDEQGRAVRPAIIHADTRSGPQATRLAREFGTGRIYRTTGCQAAPFFTITKLAWLAEHDPGALHAARWCIQSKDYLAGRLTGVVGITDPSDASLTGMLDVAAGTWWPGIVESAGAPTRILPEIVPSTHMVGPLCPGASAALGLPAGIPVVLGGGDGACATVGSGSVLPGDTYHYLGGTSWVARVTGDYMPDPEARLSHFLSLPPGQSVTYGTVQAAGSSVEWFVARVMADAGPDRYTRMEALASQAPAGSRGLLFLPYLQGERAPIWSASARGAFIGLTSSHGLPEMARAVYEGVAMALAGIVALQGGGGLAVRALGGGMKCRLWRTILAGCYNRPLHVLEHLGEATSCGAAVAAGVGVGLLPGFEAAARFAPVGLVEEPDPVLAEAYSRQMPLFQAAYPPLAGIMEGLGQ